MIENLECVGHYVMVLRDDPETEKNGLILPELSLKKPNTGKIIGVGEKVIDSRIQVGKTAVFHKSSGNAVEIFETEVTFLIQNDNQEQVLAVI